LWPVVVVVVIVAAQDRKHPDPRVSNMFGERVLFDYFRLMVVVVHELASLERMMEISFQPDTVLLLLGGGRLQD